MYVNHEKLTETIILDRQLTNLYKYLKCCFRINVEKSYLGMASRKCRTSGLWDSPSLINCTTEVFINASTQVRLMAAHFTAIYELYFLLDLCFAAKNQFV